MSKQIELMLSMQATNPTNAIGAAKELIESCCKTILDALGITWSKTDDVPQLTNKTLDALNLLPANIQSTDQGTDAIKAILGNLRSIPSKLAEIRNPLEVGMEKVHLLRGLRKDMPNWQLVIVLHLLTLYGIHTKIKSKQVKNNLNAKFIYI